MTEDTEPLSLARASENLLEECRTVVPGIQGLFGFQLIVVFTEAFDRKLNQSERIVHVISLCLVVVSLICIMTPAAYHRMTGPREATGRFIVVSTRLLLVSMAALGVAIPLDAYLVARVVLGPALGLALAGLLLILFAILWYAFPWASAQRKQRERMRTVASAGTAR